MNTDFDALASLLAAKKLYPKATIVLSDKQNTQVKNFLNIYRDMFDFVQDRDINWQEVTELIIVDVASLSRIGNFTNELPVEQMKIIVYDHHPPADKDVHPDGGVIEQVGATVTLLVEKIKQKSLDISEFEATIFGLGIYTDTGNFTYNTTTTRDFQAASYLMECGMNLEILQRFVEETLVPGQQTLLEKLFIASKSIEIDGLEIVVAIYEQEDFQGGLATLTQKLLDTKAADAVVSIVKMKHHVYIVGRASADRVNLQPLLKMFGGGGHQHAGSATVKRGNLTEITTSVKENLNLILQPAVTAKQIMTSPVKTLSPETTIEKAGDLMYRYGHSGYPIVENDRLVGIITRRDLDKANHHGLGHAPVKAYMTTNLISINPETTLEEIQNIVIEHNIGRLPVIDSEKVVGIVTRTNIIEKIHEQTQVIDKHDVVNNLKDNIKHEVESQLSPEIFSVLQHISETATKMGTNVYLIGGIVRDILLKKPNDDVDIVVEGDGIAFAKQLHKNYGGTIKIHESFGTATWQHPRGLEIDIATSRLEYYERPASLPDVEVSTLQEDLYRRDFTINAMAIYLNESQFGQLVDPFSGQSDLYNGTIKVLHNLSFVEDPTRILRAIRFETRFQFSMDERTEALAIQSMEQMRGVSANRIIHEIKRMFQEENVVKVMRRLYELDFWQQFTGEQSVAEQAMTTVEKLQSLQTYLSDESQKNEHWFIYFCIPFFAADRFNQTERFILTKHHRQIYEDIKQLTKISLEEYASKGALHRQLKSLNDESIIFIIASRKLPNETIIVQYVNERHSLRPYITGEQLKQYGLQPGPVFKKILLELEVAMLDDEIQSRKTAEDWLQQYIEKL